MNLITTTSALSAAVAELSKSDFVAVDTEFIRETTFWPELCLIQMASPDVTALVDPLAPGIDLKPFFALMADEKITKVFHAARQDVEIVYNLGNLIPSPMFDSQVAAMVCGYGESISYDQLVNKMTGVHLDKTSRFTDWRRRPLADTQLTYALADVTHLAAIYPKLRDQLVEKGRVDWVKDEMSTLTSVETYDLHPDDAWKRLKMRARRPIELATLQKIAAWREREARERNVPRSRVMKDDTLFEVAQQQPDSVEALGKLRSVPNGWERSQPAQGLVAAVNEALAIPKEDLPKLAKHVQGPEGSAAAGELLRVLLKIITEEHGVAPRVVASADELDKIAAHGDKADVQVLHGWRRELFGEMALKLIAGEVALKFEDRKVKAVAV
jgi:ribonuclease D